MTEFCQMALPLLILGSKNYSSWSLRPWMLLKHLGVNFEEVVLKLDTEQFHQEISKYSPSRRVPVLIDGDVRVWDSLAIAEFAAEQMTRWRSDVPGAEPRVWPADPAARAHARAIAAEMHAGFQTLRDLYPVNIRAKNVKVRMTPDLARDIERVDRIWSGARHRFGNGGPWLFGDYSAADAMFAPVGLRFRTYGAQLSSRSREYLDTVLNDPVLGEWIAAAQAEDHVLAKYDLRKRRTRGKGRARAASRTRSTKTASRPKRRAARKR
jgi:glutathione S-transferase